MRLLILDNYDSFTYNLVHLVEKVSNIPFDVVQNDKIGLAEIEAYSKILLSPGPGLPKHAGIMPEVLTQYHSHKSILGVCLGIQAIGECFGASLKNLDRVCHGLSLCVVVAKNDLLFQNCPQKFMGGRYHSWVLDPNSLPEQLEVTARDEAENIMAIRHAQFDVRGLQFHPESILSEFGETIIRNWLSHHQNPTLSAQNHETF